MSCSCPACGKQNSGSFPACVTAPVQYGKGVLVNNACHVSFQKVSVLFSDLFGYRVNTGTLLKANQQIYEGLSESEAQIKRELTQSPLAHFDETGTRVAGKLHWLHTCSNEHYSYLFDLRGETPGMYLLHVQSGARREIIKVVKMNR